MAGLLLLMVASHGAWAEVTCAALSGTPRTDTVQLTPAIISAGADVPLGTVIYQGRWFGSDPGQQFLCIVPDNKNIWLDVVLGIKSAPKPLSNWTGGPFGGAVYETNIPGIGIAISRNNNADAATLSQPSHQFPNGVERVVTGGSHGGFLLNRTLYVSLIKTGPITPGNYTLDASQLPAAYLYIDNAAGRPYLQGLPISLNAIQFQGQLTVSTQTCSTPDVNVPMGSFESREYFTGINATTPWVDASILLTGCPTFHGFYNADNSTLMFDYSTRKGLVAESTSNSVGVRVTPSTSVIDSPNGIMSIDRSLPNAASGVGIQLGWGSNSGNPALFDFATEKPFQLPKDGRSEIKIPLAARYIQTDNMVTPGKASGKAVFLINYY